MGRRVSNLLNVTARCWNVIWHKGFCETTCSIANITPVQFIIFIVKLNCNFLSVLSTFCYAPKKIWLMLIKILYLPSTLSYESNYTLNSYRIILEMPSTVEKFPPAIIVDELPTRNSHIPYGDWIHWDKFNLQSLT